MPLLVAEYTIEYTEARKNEQLGSGLDMGHFGLLGYSIELQLWQDRYVLSMKELFTT